MIRLVEHLGSQYIVDYVDVVQLKETCVFGVACYDHFIFIMMKSYIQI